MAKRSTFIALLGVVILVMAASAGIGQQDTGSVPPPTSGGAEAAPAAKPTVAKADEAAPAAKPAPGKVTDEKPPENRGDIDEAPPKWDGPIKNHEKRISALEIRKSQKSGKNARYSGKNPSKKSKSHPVSSDNSRLKKLEDRMDKAENRLDTHSQLVWKHEKQINGKGGLAKKMGSVWADRETDKTAQKIPPIVEPNSLKKIPAYAWILGTILILCLVAALWRRK